MGLDEPLRSAGEYINLSLDEVLQLSKDMGVSIIETSDTDVFKGGLVDGRKVVLVPKSASSDEEDILAGEILHELGHIRYGHFGSGYDDPEEFVSNELQANHWALTIKGGYLGGEWDWSVLPGIAEDLSGVFGIPLSEAWGITKKVAKRMGVSPSSLVKAEEDVRSRG